MNSAITPSLPVIAGVQDDAAQRRARAPFLPRERVTLRWCAGAALLGAASATPLMIFSSQLSQHGASDAFTEAALLPGLALVKHVVVGPLLEEVIYRGCLMQLLRRYAPATVAIVLSAALFAALHFMRGWGTMVPAMLMGCVFGWMTVRTHSLLPGLLCHMAINFTAGFILAPSFDLAAKAAAVSPGTGLAESPWGLFPIWWSAASLVVLVVSIVMLRREISSRRDTAADGSVVGPAV